MKRIATFSDSAARGFGRAAARRAKSRDIDLERLWKSDLKIYPGLRAHWDAYSWGYWDEVIAIEHPNVYAEGSL